MARGFPEQASLADRMRARIVTRMHLGGLVPGERLPGIRELARESGEDHRAVAHAYRVLEAEGLVEIRGRSGVYARTQREVHANLASATSTWLIQVLTEARRRRIKFPDLHRMLDAVSGPDGLRCACLESTEDQVVAYAWELRDGYGLDPLPIYLPPRAGAKADADTLREAMQGAHMAVTTRYHVAEVQPVADALGIPLVVLAVDADAAGDIAGLLRKRLDERPLTVIAADARFVRRLTEMADAVRPARHEIRFVLATDRVAMARLDPKEPVIITRAARERLGSRVPPILMLHAPLFAPSTIREICETIVLLTLPT